MNKLWLQFVCYSGLLVISLGLQISRPDLFAIVCTHQPIGEFLNQVNHLAVPLNSPILPQGEKPK